HTTQLLPVDADGTLVHPGGFSAQATHVFDDLARVLGTADASLSNTVKLNAYVTTAANVSQLESVLAKYFPGENRPAVTWVITDLPKTGALVAMDAVARSETTTTDVRWSQPLEPH